MSIKHPFDDTSEAVMQETDTDSTNADDSSERTAILLLDFQNELMKRGGKLHSSVSGTMEATGVLQKVPKLVDRARKMNVMIIYSSVVMKQNEKFKDSATEEEQEGVEVEEGRSTFQMNKYTEIYGLFTENTWNCEIVHEVEPRNDDIILRDRCSFSAFEGTELLSYLRDNNIKHFFVT